jgi:hypothetical protein
MKYLGDNFTRYSTEDLEELIECAYQAMRERKPGFFNPEWGDRKLKFRFVGDRLPVDVSYWGAPTRDVVMASRRLWTGRNTAPSASDVPGPWFIAPVGKKHQTGLGAAEKGPLRVLSPRQLDLYSTLGPMEALAEVAGGVQFLSPEVVAQLLCVFLLRAGAQVGNERATVIGSQTGLLEFCRIFVGEHTTKRVRVMEGVQTRREPTAVADVLRRLLTTYLTGGARNGMKWKRWTIGDKAQEYYDFWVQSEEQRRRVLAKGGVVPPDRIAVPPGDMLRELAKEYDRRCEEERTHREHK